MAVALVTQDYVERRMGGPQNLVRCADDDRDGVSDPDVVQEVLVEASRIGEGLLWDGWPDAEKISDLVAEDTSVAGAIADIACALFGQRRPEWTNDKDEPFFEWRRKNGEAVLRQMAKTERRSRSEGAGGAAGLNALVKSRRSRQDRTPGEPFFFAASDDDPKGPGGF